MPRLASLNFQCPSPEQLIHKRKCCVCFFTDSKIGHVAFYFCALYFGADQPAMSLSSSDERPCIVYLTNAESIAFFSHNHIRHGPVVCCSVRFFGGGLGCSLFRCSVRCSVRFFLEAGLGCSLFGSFFLEAGLGCSLFGSFLNLKRTSPADLNGLVGQI